MWTSMTFWTNLTPTARLMTRRNSMTAPYLWTLCVTSLAPALLSSPAESLAAVRHDTLDPHRHDALPCAVLTGGKHQLQRAGNGFEVHRRLAARASHRHEPR